MKQKELGVDVILICLMFSFTVSTSIFEKEKQKFITVGIIVLLIEYIFASNSLSQLICFSLTIMPSAYLQSQILHSTEKSVCPSIAIPSKPVLKFYLLQEHFCD